MTGGGSGINSINPLSINSLSLDDTYLNNLLKNINRSDYVKRYEVIEATEDILALSVAWKRLRDTKSESIQTGITTLLDDNLFRKIEEPDRIRANEIRDYFTLFQIDYLLTHIHGVNIHFKHKRVILGRWLKRWNCNLNGKLCNFTRWNAERYKSTIKPRVIVCSLAASYWYNQWSKLYIFYLDESGKRNAYNNVGL